MLIKVDNLSKSYKNNKRENIIQQIKKIFKNESQYIKALSDISFNIEKGEVVGYIGPNGAGKSTTIKILCGILVPDTGSCSVNGLIPWKNRKEYVRKIGVVFGQKSQLWWDLPVMDSFLLLKDIYKIDKATFFKNVDELTQILDIKDLLDKPVRQLSLGQKMRCEFVASLLHDPDILFLDEPTIGLDVLSKDKLRKFIKKINYEKKITILITTHDSQDIEKLVDRIIYIDDGKKYYDGTVGNLVSSMNEDNLENALITLYSKGG